MEAKARKLFDFVKRGHAESDGRDKTDAALLLSTEDLRTLVLPPPSIADLNDRYDRQTYRSTCGRDPEPDDASDVKEMTVAIERRDDVISTAIESILSVRLTIWRLQMIRRCRPAIVVETRNRSTP